MTVKERLLRIAAESYIKAQRLNEAAHPPTVDDYALFLYQQRNTMPEPLQDIVLEVRLPLRDVYEIVRALEDAPYFKDQYEQTREAQNTWIEAWTSA